MTTFHTVSHALDLMSLDDDGNETRQSVARRIATIVSAYCIDDIPAHDITVTDAEAYIVAHHDEAFETPSCAEFNSVIMGPLSTYHLASDYQRIVNGTQAHAFASQDA